jgi:hypothetical protein
MNDVPVYLWVLVGTLLGSVLVWFGLVSALFRRLALHHPAKYREMGEPGLITNNPPQASLTLMRFIFRREDRSLHDPGVSRLTAVMLVFSICFFVLLLFGMIKVLSMTPTHYAKSP